MSEQDALSTTPKRSKNRPTIKQSDRNRPAPRRPVTDDKEAWKTYWKTQGQPWRTEPEIDMVRQKYLAQCRSTTPNIEQDIYPFKDIKLCRADVEWLLATHENGRGPIDWRDESQRERKGLDLRGADLRQVDLRGLPLTCVCGGLEGEWWNAIPNEQLEKAAIHLEGADLRTTNLEKAELSGAHMEGADLRTTNLEHANLCRAHLEGTRMHFANLESAFIRAAHLERAILYTTNLKKAILIGVHLENTYLNEAYLEGSHLEGVILGDQRRVGPQVADTHWDNTNLAVINWSQVEMLGDEYEAQQKKRDGMAKDNAVRIKEYDRAVRANRQLAVALQAQGMNEIAARFSYRAQVLQRQVLQQHVLRNLEQTKEALHTQEYEGVGLDELSNILLMFLHLLHLPSSQLIKFEQSQKDFFLKRLILLLTQLAFFLYVLALFVLAFCILLVRWPLLFMWLMGLGLSLAVLLPLKYLPDRQQLPQRLQAVLTLLRVEKFKRESLATFQQFLLTGKLFINMITDNGQYAFFLLLDLLAGYGYKPGRSFFIYLLVIFGFTIAYSTTGHLPPFPDAFVFSLMSFHGRGFFPSLSGESNLHNPLVVLAAFEAVIGLFVEISFIATFTQRFFGK